jgi:hypothetical protein
VPTLRDDLEPVVDELRGLANDLGFRPYTVTVRTRTWSGGAVGRGSATVSDRVLSPVPKVQDVPARLVVGPGGKYETGDRIVRKVSRSYTLSQLGASALNAGVEVEWLIDSDRYRLVSEPEKRSLEWVVHLRRIAR